MSLKKTFDMCWEKYKDDVILSKVKVPYECPRCKSDMIDMKMNSKKDKYLIKCHRCGFDEQE